MSSDATEPENAEALLPAKSAEAAPSAPSCVLQKDEEFIGLDWARRTTYQGICASALWLDQLFGDEIKDASEYQIEGYLGANLEKQKGGTMDFSPKLRMRLKLPNLSHKFDLFFEREDENKTIAGESDSAVTRQLGSGGQESSQVGLGYEIMRGLDSLLNFRLGMRLIDRKLDPFVRSRYTLDFAKSERAEWRFGQTLFYRHMEGFGETTSLDYEKRMGGPFVFRWNTSATVSQTTEAFKWGSGVSVLHPVDERRTLIYSYSASGDTGRAINVNSFGPRVGYRQQMQRRWLFGEIYAGVDRPKLEPGETRPVTPYIGAKLEAHFKNE